MSLRNFVVSILPSRNARLIATFAGFVLVQVLFAGIYFSLYRHRRGHFSFNSDILRAQAGQVAAQAANNESCIQVLQEALQELEAGATPTEAARGSQLKLPSGRMATITLLSGPPAGGPGGSLLELFDVDGRRL